MSQKKIIVCDMVGARTVHSLCKENACNFHVNNWNCAFVVDSWHIEIIVRSNDSNVIVIVIDEGYKTCRIFFLLFKWKLHADATAMVAAFCGSAALSSTLARLVLKFS